MVHDAEESNKLNILDAFEIHEHFKSRHFNIIIDQLNLSFLYNSLGQL